jgi:LacI family transcriptional regulator
MTVCNEEGIPIPEAVALIGSDNDEVSCDLCCPTLSSVDSNGVRIGYDAAALLHRLMEGRVRKPQHITIDPAGVVRRRSTDVMAVDEPLVASALRQIHERVGQGLTTADVLRQSGVSRATLDRSFRKALKRTPRAEIARVRIRRVEELLATTDLPLKQIARLTGFAHAETMHRVFKKATGMTPVQHRRRAGAQKHHKI